MKRFFRALSLAVMAGIFMWGCASAPNPAMQSARAAFERARAMPDVMENAAADMYDAEKILRKAEEADDWDEMTYLANQAEKKVEYAVSVAEMETAEKEEAEPEEEEPKVLLDTREHDGD